MSCSHTTGCPLFPLLNASLRGWRTYYCDSDDRWRECARYQTASRGELVPISLLPNGVDAAHIRRDADQSSPANPVQLPLAQADAGPAGACFEPAPEPDRPHEPQPPQPAHAPEPAPSPPASPLPESPPARPSRPVLVLAAVLRGAHHCWSRIRCWWNQIAEWMGAPA